MLGEVRTTVVCRPPLFRCADGRCVPPAVLCNRVNDCRDDSDEGSKTGCSWYLKMQPLTNEDGGGQMPGGIIAAIVICSLLAVAAIVVGILILVLFIKRRRRRRKEDEEDQRPASANTGQDDVDADLNAMKDAPGEADVQMDPRELQPSVAAVSNLGIPPQLGDYPQTVDMRRGDRTLAQGEDIEMARITKGIRLSLQEVQLDPTGNYGEEGVRNVIRNISVTLEGDTPDSDRVYVTDSMESLETAGLPLHGPEPPNLPSWKDAIAKTYPGNADLVKPSASTPSLFGLDRVPEAPSIGSLHHYLASCSGRGVYSQSLPDITYQSAFKRVTTSGGFRRDSYNNSSIRSRTKSVGHLTFLPTNNFTNNNSPNTTGVWAMRSHDIEIHPMEESHRGHRHYGNMAGELARSTGQIYTESANTQNREVQEAKGSGWKYARSASVPVGYYAEDEQGHYAVPLSVYKVPPPPRRVESGAYRDMQDFYHDTY